MYGAIDFLTEWTTYLLVITPFAAGAMVTYQAIRKSFSDDEDIICECGKRISNTIKGAIIIVTASGTIEAIKTFFV